MPPTAAATTLGGAAAGRRVNLELPLRAGDRLGGHIVQGHVDAVARVIGLSRRGETVGMEIASPSELEPYLADKGSVAVDGVSLTLARVGGGRFAVSLVRATLERTNLGERKPGDLVNLEADIIAKYVARFLLHRERALRPPGAGDLSLAAAEARERALAGLLEEGEQV
jgi:riboflavin synthase